MPQAEYVLRALHRRQPLVQPGAVGSARTDDT